MVSMSREDVEDKEQRGRNKSSIFSNSIESQTSIERMEVDLFQDMPCMKRVYRDKKASFHWSAARKKKRFSSR